MRIALCRGDVLNREFGEFRLTFWYTNPLSAVKVAMEAIPVAPLTKPDQIHKGLAATNRSPLKLLLMTTGYPNTIINKSAIAKLIISGVTLFLQCSRCLSTTIVNRFPKKPTSKIRNIMIPYTMNTFCHLKGWVSLSLMLDALVDIESHSLLAYLEEKGQQSQTFTC